MSDDVGLFRQINIAGKSCQFLSQSELNRDVITFSSHCCHFCRDSSITDLKVIFNTVIFSDTMTLIMVIYKVIPIQFITFLNRYISFINVTKVVLFITVQDGKVSVMV